ncbi:MAG TPA: methyltransferase domain-containing protein [Actinomycetota bacterium]|nr:methyltransferase domain-containing protein [Actinomycetota bacterium]
MTEQTVAELAQAYGERADSYEDLWAPVLRPKGRALLDALEPDAAETFLDLGTGTGTLLGEIAEVAPRARIVAVDRSEGMIRLARGDAMRAVMDAQAIALGGETIDAGVMAFVIFTVPDPPGVLAEVHRVLRPGARFGVATWGDEPDVPADAVWTEELAEAGADADPVTAINRRDITDTPEKLSALFAAAGFTDVRTWTDRLDLIWKPDDYIRFISAGGPTRRRLDTLDPTDQKRCLDRVRARLTDLGPDDLAERSEIVYAIGIRP